MEAKVELQPKSRHGLDVLFLSLTTLIFLINTLPYIRVSDYNSHIAFAVEMAENTPVPISHALYQKLILVLRTLIPFRALQNQSGIWQYLYVQSFTICAILIALAAYIATILTLKKRFYQNWKDSLADRAYFYAWLAAFSLLLVNPITLTSIRGNYLIVLGYIPANIWHSPTYILMRPLGLWLFFFIIDHWDQRLVWKQWLLVATISYLVIFAKPNFTLSMLPTFGLICMLKIFKFKRWNWGLITAFVLPSLFSLAYQYWFMSQFPKISSFIFAPFRAAFYYTGNGFTLIAMIVLSITFPLFLLLFDSKRILRRVDFSFAWLNFAVAMLIFLLFAEIPHIEHLNFAWGPMMAVFLLFAVSLNYIVQDYHCLKGRKWETNLLLGLAIMHIIFGLLFIVLTLI